MFAVVMNVLVYKSKQEVQEVQKRADVLEKRITDANTKLDSVVKATYKSDDIIKKIDELSVIVSKLENKVKETSEQQLKNKKEISRTSRGFVMRATAYDLTVKSCGKKKGHPQYGITKSGTRATRGRTVAVDPRKIPLGSTLHIKFPDKYKYLDGTYIAEDTGGAVKGDIIDIFLGNNEKEVDKFGCQKVTVHVIRKPT